MEPVNVHGFIYPVSKVIFSFNKIYRSKLLLFSWNSEMVLKQ